MPELAPPVRSRHWLLRADFQYGFWVTLFAAVIHFVRLNIPKSLIPLDEFYYPVNALGLMRHGADYLLSAGAALPAKMCSAVAIEPQFAVHPPIGKWLIAIGMRIFGCNSFGWRFSSAIFGTLSILLVYLIGRRLFRTPWAAALAAFFVTTDGLFFMQSRIAMLDIFLAFFIVLAIWLLLEDRARTSSDHHGWRWWRISSAVAIGLGASTKWSAAAVIPFLAILALAWEIERLRTNTQSQMLPALERLEPLDFSVAESKGEPEYEAFWEPAHTTIPLEPHSPAWSAGNEPREEPAEQSTQDSEPDEQQAEELAPELSAHDEHELPPLPPLPQPREKLPWSKALGSTLRLATTFLLIPLVVYLFSYVPWFASGNVIKDGKPQTARYTAPRCVDVQANSNIAAFTRQANVWLCYQREIWDFHKNLQTLDKKGKPSHPYLSRAWSWPWMGRPTSHYFEQTGFDAPCGQASRIRVSGEISTAGFNRVAKSGAKTQTPAPVAPVNPARACKSDSEILGLPNPASWFAAFFLGIPLCIWWAIKRRDQVAAMLLLLFVPLFLPWLITTRPLFLFYMTPAVPILALMLAHMIHRSIATLPPWRNTILFGLLLSIPFTPLYMQWLHTGTTSQLAYKIPLIGVFALVGMGLASLMAYTPRPQRLAVAYASLVLAVFGYFYPVLAAVHIPENGWFGWRKHMWVQQDCGQQTILLNCWI